MYYNFKPDNDETCVSRGICSTSPEIAALQEIMFILLRGLAYYVTKLELSGARNANIKINMIKNIVYLASLQEYTDEQVHQIVNDLFSIFINTEKTYKNFCTRNEIIFDKFNSPIKFENNMDMNRLIAEGDKVYKNKFRSLEKDIKNYTEILFCMLKSLAFLLVELDDNGIECIDVQKDIVRALNLYNQHNLSTEKLRKLIYELADQNAELIFKLNDIKTDKFGEIRYTQVPRSSHKGKAILVSGNNLSELEEVLELTGEKDINVYTNGNLLIAHAYEKFGEYKNLKGHFGSGAETSVLDFATFPGAILLTKNEAHNVEYLYRGRIFSTEDIPPKGVAKLQTGNLSPLIDAALNTKGFARGHNREAISVGYNIKEIESKFAEIARKLHSGEYKYLFIIGLANQNYQQDEYFKNLFMQKPENAAVISFSYNAMCKNTYVINIANDYSLATSLLYKLFEQVPVDSPQLTFFLTRCDNSAFAGMVRLNRKGAKNIFMSACQPNIMNPATLDAFKQLYNIHSMTSAGEDLEKILNAETG